MDVMWFELEVLCNVFVFEVLIVDFEVLDILGVEIDVLCSEVVVM